jgi:choline kinase
MSIHTAVICAAGMGTRLGMNIPKCLLEFKKKPILYYLLKLLEDVDNVRMVVGFMEKDVIKYARSLRDDIVFVRNPQYQHTTNSYSLYLGSRDLDRPFLNVDGDMIIDKVTFSEFKRNCQQFDNVIGVTKVKTEDAVFVDLNDQNEVIGFSRQLNGQSLEWSGIAYFSTIKMDPEANYVYEVLEKHLPLKSLYVECYEIDTPQDLASALSEVDFI